MIKIKSSKYIWIVALVIGVLVGDFTFNNTEMGVYESYPRSFLDDGDLNILNQIFYSDDKKMVSPTGYYYTHHNYGSALYTIPILLYSRIIGKLMGLEHDGINTGERGNRKNLKVFNYRFDSLEFFGSFYLAVGVFLLTLVSLFSLYKNFLKTFLKENKNHDLYRNHIIVLLFSGPLTYYLFWAQSTPNLLIFIPMGLMFYFSRKLESLNANLYLGVSFGLGFITRVDFSLYGLFIILWWIEYKPSLRYYLAQALGLFLSVFPFVIYEINRLGEFSFGYFNTFYLNWINVIDFYFSPYRGVLISHPIVIVQIFLGLFILLREGKSHWSKWKRELFVCLTILILKSLLLSLTYSHGGGVLGPRQLLQDVVLLSFFTSIYSFEYKQLRLLFVLAFIYNIMLSLVYAHLDLYGLNLFNFGESYFDFYHNYITNIGNFLTKISETLNIQNLYNSIVVSIPIFILMFMIRNKKEKLVAPLVISLMILNMSIIGIDTVSNKEKLSKYEKTSNSLKTLMYHENIGSMIDRIDYLNSMGRFTEAKEFIKIVVRYHNEVKDKSF